nr:class I adenylate cyclase [Desulfobacula sp.]
MEKNRSAFSNYNMVRMREAIRYLTPEKLEIFIKIPFLLHINFPEYPGFIDNKVLSHGIWNFENSGFYKEVLKTKIFPKSVIENIKIDRPSILGFYHIGSLGTFTQSIGSDFDYWVIIDKKKFSKERYAILEEKLDAILKYSREAYEQEVTFFIMDQKDIKNNCYALFKGEETLTASKIFLKEEFYRTFLMIAGKIPIWSVLPGPQESKKNTVFNTDGITAQILSMHDDLIDLGQIDSIPIEDVLKGLLWQICKSGSDPVKALIKATMVFSYGFGQTANQCLLCEKIKQGYSKAGIDDYDVDPYKAVFDRILEFHKREDPKVFNLIKNAIFFRLCEYPDVKMPNKNTPKRLLLNKYIRTWKLSKDQVEKLLSYSTWSESEKLLLEKTFIQRLAQMYNHAIEETNKTKHLLNMETEKRNWTILRNKTRERLGKSSNRISECSTYLKRRNILRLDIIKKSDSWELNVVTQAGKKIDRLYNHSHLLGVWGWILENQLYRRHTATIALDADLKLFKAGNNPIDMDKMYMVFQPLKPLSDNCYEKESSWSKMMILLLYDKNIINTAEFLISNTWGELFFDRIEFVQKINKEDHCNQIAEFMLKYSGQSLRFFIYQLSDTHDPKIVYQLKKAYNDLADTDGKAISTRKKPYLDRL